MRPALRLKRVALCGGAVAALAAIVACGGGGSSSAGSGSAPGASSSLATATFSVAVPSATAGTSASSRRPAYISPNAQSIAVAISSGTAPAGTPVTANLTPTSPNCTAATATLPLTCTVSLIAPVGSDSFAVTLYQGLNGSGNVLATSTVTATISATAPTTIPVTLGGVIASIAVTVTNGNNLIPGGYPTTLPVVVTAKDASGAAIVGSAAYTSPITLTNADTSGITTLSTTTVTSPATTVTLAYTPTDANGGVLAITGLPVGATTIGASASGVAPTAILPGTFQYIADRFFGYGHTRTLTGTASAITTTYNSSSTPSPNPSTYAYTLSDAITVHAAGNFNGTMLPYANHQRTFTQTAPVTSASPEVNTNAEYRLYVPTSTGATIYRIGQSTVNVNPGSRTSPITGQEDGTVDITDTFPSQGAWEIDTLPHRTATWTNNFVPFMEVDSNGEVSTFQNNADGSTAFSETAPSTIMQAATALGSGSSVNGGITTTISPPVPAASPATGYIIPVAQETTSPAPAPTSYSTPLDWYPGGGAPALPLYSYQYAQSTAAIPMACNVPSSIATQAYVIVEQDSALQLAQFKFRQQTYTDYYVPGGIGFVCETFVQTTSAYRYTTGTISSITVTTYTESVTNASNLAIHRRP